MLISFFFASALSALHLYNEPKFMVIGDPVILEQYHAHDASELWDRGSIELQNVLVCDCISWVVAFSFPLNSFVNHLVVTSFLLYFLAFCREGYSTS